jgi:hypothetical protein
MTEALPGDFKTMTLGQAINWLCQYIGVSVSEAVDIINEWLRIQ